MQSRHHITVFHVRQAADVQNEFRPAALCGDLITASLSIPSARGRAASVDLVAFVPRIRAIPTSRVHYYYHLVKDPELELLSQELPSVPASGKSS
jgi:hypothetical protein